MRTNSSRLRSLFRAPRSVLRMSTRSSEHGPQGPVSPICQKLSLSPRPKMRLSEMPVTWRHSLRASSSEWWTVTYSRSGSMPRHSLLVTRPDALLACHRAAKVTPFQALKHAFELHHSGVGEEQRRVVGGHEG